MQAFVPLFGSPLFGLIYKNTVETLPQTYLIVLAAFFAIDWLLLLIINRGCESIDKKRSAAMELASEEEKKALGVVD